MKIKLFQSTLPVWGATLEKSPLFQKISDFNPRSPCGERPGSHQGEVIPMVISIHAPRVGSDLRRCGRRSIRRNFNPRSPCGERPGS